MVLYSTVRYGTVMSSQLWHRMVEYQTLQNGVVEYTTVQYSIIESMTTQHGTEYSTVYNGTVPVEGADFFQFRKPSAGTDWCSVLP